MIVLNQPFLALISQGKQNGIVFDCGETQSSATAIFNGRIMKETISWSDIGGRNINEYLQSSLKLNNNETYYKEIVRDLKHKKCGFKPHENISYQLPDQSLIDVGWDQ